MEDGLFPSSEKRLTLGPDDCRLLEWLANVDKWNYRMDATRLASRVKALAWSQIAIGEGTDFLHLPSNLLIIPVRNELSKCCDPTARE